MNPVNNCGETPLHCATKSGHLDICKFIIVIVTLNNPADKHDFTSLIVERIGVEKLIKMLIKIRLMQFEFM